MDDTSIKSDSHSSRKPALNPDEYMAPQDESTSSFELNSTFHKSLSK